MSAKSFSRETRLGVTIYSMGEWRIIPVAKSYERAAHWASSVEGDPHSAKKHDSLAAAKARVLADAPTYTPTIFEDQDENGEGIGQAFRVGSRVVACFEQNPNGKVVGLNLLQSNLLVVFDGEADEIEMTVNYFNLEARS